MRRAAGRDTCRPRTRATARATASACATSAAVWSSRSRRCRPTGACRRRARSVAAAAADAMRAAWPRAWERGAGSWQLERGGYLQTCLKWVLPSASRYGTAEHTGAAGTLGFRRLLVWAGGWGAGAGFTSLAARRGATGSAGGERRCSRLGGAAVSAAAEGVAAGGGCAGAGALVVTAVPAAPGRGTDPSSTRERGRRPRPARPRRRCPRRHSSCRPAPRAV